MMLEAEICLVVGGIIIVILSFFFYGIANEVEFEKQCFERGGKMLNTNDKFICIKKDAII